ncbi:NADPH-dependent F420 reductase [Rhodoferax aquaticus]|uniref:DNA-binding protein n=1 Tax=Rhodoferax aquaticus TaxID=2527691 RepID=A0A515ELS6_9BURK|nr:NAD(P)-binding domain-containing protein [Rhodoferax aquaticus]QDL53612.1 DNA-binding protein [Rhodoferax aquaticus]
MTNTNPKTVAILGNGVVGIALAKGFAELGYAVVFGTRDAQGEKTVQALAAVPGATAASFSEAARASSVAVLALPWSGLEAGVLAAGAENLAGKLVIDPSNPLDFSTGAPTLAVGHTDSAGELVQRLLPTAKVVKAFNIITAGHMVHPKLLDGTPDMLIAGNDAEAKAHVGALLLAFGWRAPIDMGDITASRLLEPLAMVWISYGFRNNHWTHGFSLLGQKA